MDNVIPFGKNNTVKKLEINTDYFNKYLSKNNLFYKDLVENVSSNKLNELSSVDRNNFKYFKQAITNLTSNEEFIEKVLFRLNLLQRYGKFKWKDNEIIGVISGNKTHKVKVKLLDNGIYFYNKGNNFKNSGYLKEVGDKYFINYSDRTRSSILNLNSLNDYITEKVENNAYLYDNNDYELYAKITTKNDNYMHDKNNNTIILLPTDTLENSVEIKKYYRVKDVILYEYAIKYFNKNHSYREGLFNPKVINKSEFYIGDNYISSDRHLPKNTFFQRVEEDAFQKVLRKK